MAVRRAHNRWHYWMLFNSLEFLIFFPVVTTLFFLLGRRERVYLLIVASCVFYMAFIPAYILIILFLILVDYTAGLLIERSQGRRRKTMLLMSLIANCSLLGFFKYFNFFNDNFAAIFGWLGWSYSIANMSIILPIGLSFHTFQSMSYTIEVYRGKQQAVHSLPKFAVYVLFYPQLVAGPIERPQNLLHQFDEDHRFDYDRVVDGLKLMTWGMFKKVVVADRLAVVANGVYNDPSACNGPLLAIGTVAFAYQIYCDFSGYSDIAIGAARVMGFKLMTNFNRPYYAKSISEFWSRWHISLSTWFRDYVYIPLGGNRVSKPRWYVNLMIVFLVSGLWHGANWTFVIWGALHGTYLVVGVLTHDLRERFAHRIGLTRLPRLRNLWRMGVVFLLVTVGWIFFRAGSVQDAWYVLTHLATGWNQVPSPAALLSQLDRLGIGSTTILLACLGLAILESLQLGQRHTSLRAWVARRPAYVRWPLYYGALACIILLGVFTKSQFIYFQF